MEREIIEIFKNSVESLLDEVADSGIKKIDVLSIKPEKLIKTGIVVIISVVGDKSGEIIIEFNKDIGLKLVEKLSKGQTTDINSEIGTATVLEFCNLLMGRTITALLENNGLDLNVSSPVLILSDSMDIITYRKESVHLKFETTIGEFSFILSLVDSPQRLNSEDNFSNEDLLNF